MKWRKRSPVIETWTLKARNERFATRSTFTQERSPTNYDAIVDEALSRARLLVDVGKSGLARAALRKASEDLRHQEKARQEARRHEEEEQRERYVAGLTVIHNRERDIALATYDGEAASDAIVALAEALHGANAALLVWFLNSEATTLYDYGSDRGSNVHLAASIVLSSPSQYSR
jgi:hypothetical protein